MSNRAFGVEIECYMPSGMYDDDYDYDDYCCEECSSSRGGEGVKSFLSRNGFSHWAELAGYDDSLGGGGIEIRSPILQGKEGFKELESVFNLLKREGFYTDYDCGMHVHHDAPEFISNRDLTIQLVKSWYDNQDLIKNMVGIDRWDNDYCPPWTEDDIEALVFERNDYYQDRNNLNISSLQYHGSIEIRFHEGTMNYPEAEAWIRFGQKFIDSVSKRKNPIRKMSDEELLMRRLKVAENTKNHLRRKINSNKNYIVTRGY